MPEELLHIGLRVLSRLLADPPEEPALADVECLRQSVPSEERDLQLDSLACHVIEREVKRGKARGAAE